MGDWNLGSVASFVYDAVEGIPTALSGTRLMEIADQQRQYVQDRTGLTIGSNGISIQYQSIIWKLTAAESLGIINVTGFKGNSTSLGDFSISKGSDASAVIQMNSLRDSAMKELENLGVSVKYYKALG
jgi:hypothetical protein